MNLPFQTHWPKRMGDLAGQPTNFVPKIMDTQHLVTIGNYLYKLPEFNANYDWTEKRIPKLHTIREDKKKRWREGMDIHFVINNRTKDRYQFMPVIKCTGVQEITITNNGTFIYTHIENRMLPLSEEIKLAENDGFPNVVTFWDWFVPNKGDVFKGRIIHWTDKRY